MSYKFDEATVKNNDGVIVVPTISIKELTVIKNTDNLKFMEEYDHKLYCPECHKPQLCLVSHNDSTYYLKGFPNQEHDNNCSYSFVSTTQKAVEELLNSSPAFVNTKLKSIIDRYLRGMTNTSSKLLVKTHNGKVLAKDVQSSDLISRKSISRLPIKSLTMPFYESDYNVFKLFYGKVDIEIINIKKDNNEFYSLKIFTPKNSNMYISVTMSSNVFSHTDLQRLSTNTKYKDILLAVATKFVKNKSFTNGHITHSSFLVLEV